MPRALIPVGTGIALRNVLRTGLPSALRRRGIEPTYAVSAALYDELSREAEQLPGDIAVLPELPTARSETVLRDLAFGIVQRRCRIATMDILLRERARHRERTPWKERAAPLLGRSRAVYRLVRSLRRRVIDVSAVAPLLDHVRPDVVFANNIFNHEEAAVLRAARDRGIATVGMVHSWDNPSTKGDLPIHADVVLVWSDAMASEMTEYFGYPDERMPRVGSPQFDVYAQDLPTTRDDLLEHYGFDAGTALITYATGSPGHCPWEVRYPQILLRLLEDRPDARLVVRLHPRDRAERYAALQGLPNVRVELAGRAGTGVDDRWNPTDEDHVHFAALMRYSDVVVNIASTIALDAAANDTPSVHVGFDAESGIDYLDSVTRFFDYTHIQRIVARNAAPIARNAEQLLDAVRNALAHPDDRAAERRDLAVQEGYDRCGHSAERIADAIASAAQRVRTKS